MWVTRGNGGSYPSAIRKNARVRRSLQGDKMTTFQIQINPLAFLKVDEPWAPKDGSLPSYEDVLEFVCSPDQTYDVKSLIDRYRRISIESQRLFAAPVEKNILEKLVWP